MHIKSSACSNKCTTLSRHCCWAVTESSSKGIAKRKKMACLWKIGRSWPWGELLGNDSRLSPIEVQMLTERWSNYFSHFARCACVCVRTGDPWMSGCSWPREAASPHSAMEKRCSSVLLLRQLEEITTRFQIYSTCNISHADAITGRWCSSIITLEAKSLRTSRLKIFNNGFNTFPVSMPAIYFCWRQESSIRSRFSSAWMHDIGIPKVIILHTPSRLRLF